MKSESANCGAERTGTSSTGLVVVGPLNGIGVASRVPQRSWHHRGADSGFGIRSVGNPGFGTSSHGGVGVPDPPVPCED